MKFANRAAILGKGLSDTTTVADLVERIQKAQRHLGPRNPYRLLFDECLAALVSVSVQLAQTQRELHLATQPKTVGNPDRVMPPELPQEMPDTVTVEGNALGGATPRQTGCLVEIEAPEERVGEAVV